MNAVQRPIVKSCHAEGASITDTFVEYLPRLFWCATDAYGNVEHLAEMIGLGVAYPVRRQADPRLWIPEATRHRRITTLRSTRDRGG